MSSNSPFPHNPDVIKRVEPYLPTFLKAWLPPIKKQSDGYLFCAPLLYERDFFIYPDLTWQGRSQKGKGEGILSLYAYLNQTESIQEAETCLVKAIWQNFYPYVVKSPYPFNYKDYEGKHVLTKIITLENGRLKKTITRVNHNKISRLGIPLFGLSALMSEDERVSRKVFILPTEMEVQVARTLLGERALFTTLISMTGKWERRDMDFTPITNRRVIVFINTPRKKIAEALQETDNICHIIKKGWGPISLEVANPNPYAYQRALWGTNQHYVDFWKELEVVPYEDFIKIAKEAPSQYRPLDQKKKIHESTRNSRVGEEDGTREAGKGTGETRTTALETRKEKQGERKDGKKAAGKKVEKDRKDNRGRQESGFVPAVNLLADNSPLKVLGTMEDKEKSGVIYVFQSRETGVIHRLRPGDFTQNQLKSMLSGSFWEDTFVARGVEGQKSNWIHLATSSLMKACKDLSGIRGFVNVDEKRCGRGVFYLTGDRFAAHLGNNIIVEKETKKPIDVDDPDFIFQTQEPIGLKRTAPASNSELQDFLELCRKPLWSGHQETSARFLAGWCAIAPFCGALDWKPHLFIYGPAFSGKSKVREMIVEKAVGPWSRNAQGVSTEAGIRRMLEFDALPVIHDEADVVEAEKKRGGETVLAKLLKLARTASSEGKGRIIHGDGKTYRIRSMFLFIDISPNISEAADVSRFTKLGLKSRPITKKGEVDDNWKKYVNLSEGLGDDFASRLFFFMWMYRHRIHETIKLFHTELLIGYFGNNGRIADLISPMLAAAYLIDNEGHKPTKEETRNNLRNYDFDEVIEISQQTDELILLDTLLSLSTTLRGEVGSTPTIRDMILNQHRGAGYSQHDLDDERRILRRLGFYVKGDWLGIANRTPFLKQALAGERFSSNIREMLLNIHGAQPGNPTSFGGAKHKHVKIPMEIILERLGKGEKNE